MRTTSHLSVGLWTAGGILLAGVIGALLWGLLAYQSLGDRLEALPRTGVPGEVTFAVDAPRGVTVFYEDTRGSEGFVVVTNQVSTITTSPVELSIDGPDGPHELARYQRDLRFDVDGRVATALATFDAPAAGTYTLQVSGDVPEGMMVSVGDVVTPGLLANAAGIVALFVATFVAAVVIAALALARHSPRTPTAPAPRDAGTDRPRSRV